MSQCVSAPRRETRTLRAGELWTRVQERLSRPLWRCLLLALGEAGRCSVRLPGTLHLWLCRAPLAGGGGSFLGLCTGGPPQPGGGEQLLQRPWHGASGAWVLPCLAPTPHDLGKAPVPLWAPGVSPQPLGLPGTRVPIGAEGRKDRGEASTGRREELVSFLVCTWPESSLHRCTRLGGYGP